MKKNTLRQKGYSLATLAILVAAFSAATVGLMTYTQHAPSLDKKADDLNEINQTLQYLKNYGTANSALPCPADPTLPPSNTNYLRSAGTYPSCDSTLPRSSTNYYKGLLPTRTLGINDKNAFDSNGALLTYMVSTGTNSFKVNIAANCLNKEGTLQSGCSYTDNNQFIQFTASTAPNVVLISHGADQVGAFKKNQTAVTSFSKSNHQIDAPLLPNNTRFDSLPQAINSDLYLSSNLDEIIFKPNAQLGNPANSSQTPNNIKYDDTVAYTRIEVTSPTKDSVYCWGRSTYGGTAPASIKVKSIASNLDSSFMCAIKADDTVQCWGGDGVVTSGGVTPTPIITAKSVVGANSRVCAIKSDDTVQCWGTNSPPPASITVKKLFPIRYGGLCAIKSNNEVACWGDGYAITQTPSSLLVKEIVGDSNVICSIRTDDNTRCWGTHSMGAGLSSTPFQAKLITSNSSVNCAIRTDNNNIQCYGQEYTGGEGPGSTMQALHITSGTNGYICAIRTDNTPFCWRGYGEPNIAPTIQVKSLVDNGSSFCAIRLDDTVQCWGGSAATGGVAPASIQAKSITPGAGAMCAIKLDNSVQCWGNTTNGGNLPAAIKASAVVANNSAMCAILE